MNDTTTISIFCGKQTIYGQNNLWTGKLVDWTICKIVNLWTDNCLHHCCSNYPIQFP